MKLIFLKVALAKIVQKFYYIMWGNGVLTDEI